jgi:hypothetical protein
MRFLAEESARIGAVLDAILRVRARRRQSAARVEPLKFVGRGNAQAEAAAADGLNAPRRLASAADTG